MNEKQKSNLAKTALVMLKSQIPLDMSRYFGNKDIPDTDIVVELEEYRKCGTVACFAGFAPLAGLCSEHSRWDHYIEEVFTEDYREYNFLFNNEWPDDKRQAAARAVHFLRFGVPFMFGYKDTYDETNLENRLKSFTKEIDGE